MLKLHNVETYVDPSDIICQIIRHEGIDLVIDIIIEEYGLEYFCEILQEEYDIAPYITTNN